MSIATMPERPLVSLDKSEGTHGAVFPTELGWMALTVRNQTLIGLTFGNASADKAAAALARILNATPALRDAKSFASEDANSQQVRRLLDDLQRYAAGEPVNFSSVALNLDHLTPFGRRIIANCRRIPFGQTRSYGELAAACGSPGAARAVGQAMAKNRYPLIVPCHRVLASGGKIGGFSAPDGLRTKRRLLALEMDQQRGDS
jgi:methylated-DNA-[protein]-cysteine S-methyltransferase